MPGVEAETKPNEPGQLERAAYAVCEIEIEKAAADGKAATDRIWFVASSEEPMERYGYDPAGNWGRWREVLSHDPGGMELERLKAAGLMHYHHNLETARTFFPNVCTTHSYESQLETIRTAKRLGFKLCSGGILGMGETPEQRVEFAFELAELEARDCGKPMKQARADITAAARYFEFYGAAADKFHGDTIPTTPSGP